MEFTPGNTLNELVLDVFLKFCTSYTVCMSMDMMKVKSFNLGSVLVVLVRVGINTCQDFTKGLTN